MTNERESKTHNRAPSLARRWILHGVRAVKDSERYNIPTFEPWGFNLELPLQKGTFWPVVMLVLFFGWQNLKTSHKLGKTSKIGHLDERSPR